MPFNRKNDPATWTAFSAYIRFERVNSAYECSGECGEQHGGAPNAMGQPMCGRRHGEQRIGRKPLVLTVAHLCECTPPCANDAHVKAMCERCHVRRDLTMHEAHAKATRARRRAPGQLDLFSS